MMKELLGIKMVEQKSRFYAHLYHIESPSDEEEIIKLHRRKYKKANHHCYALRFQGQEKAKDDGEVGHPGKVLLEILESNKLDSHILMVSRVFGGIKLGVGGVSRAFREVGQAVIDSLDQSYRKSNNP